MPHYISAAVGNPSRIARGHWFARTPQRAIIGDAQLHTLAEFLRTLSVWAKRSGRPPKAKGKAPQWRNNCPKSKASSKKADSGIWWIRYADSTGKIRREVGGTREGAAGILYRKRKAEILQGRKLPETLRKGETSFRDLAELVRNYSRSSGKHSSGHRATIRQQLARLEGWWGDGVAAKVSCPLKSRTSALLTAKRFRRSTATGLHSLLPISSDARRPD